MKLKDLTYLNKVKVCDTDVLLAIDVQPDFMPGGNLAVEEGDQVVAVINRLLPLFPYSVASQDWHPEDHSSFKTNSDQGIWPPHCIQGSKGAELHPDLLDNHLDVVIRKGTDTGVDSYSAFRDNDKKAVTGLAGLLKERRVGRVFLVGLALDFCVRFTAEDARENGLETVIVTDACRSVKLPGDDEDSRNSEEKALEVLVEKGVHFVQSTSLVDTAS